MLSLKRPCLSIATLAGTLALSIFSLNIVAKPEIEDIINCFAGKNKLYSIKPFLGPVGLIEVNEQGRTYSYYGVHFGNQEEV
jgi:hypothetical protein